MQLMLGFAQEASNESEPSPSVWQTLPTEQRRETLAVLARLIAKTAAACAAADPNQPRREPHDD